MQAGAGGASGFPDEDYRAEGAAVGDRDHALGADIVLRVGQPDAEDVAKLRAGAIHIGFLDPFNETALVRSMADQRVTAISMQDDPSHKSGAEDGRAVLPSEPRGLCGRHPRITV